MPVPSSITELATSEGANSPSGSESPTTADDYLRALSAFIAQLFDTSVRVLESVAGTNAITGTSDLEFNGYNNKQIFIFIAANTNTDATTININGKGAKSILQGTEELIGGEIVEGSFIGVAYGGSNMQLLFCSASINGLRGRLNGDMIVRNGAQNVMKFDNVGDIASGPDITFYASALLAAPDEFWIAIDSDNNSSNAKLVIAKDANNSGATVLAQFRESGAFLLGTTSVGSGLQRIVESNAQCLELSNSDSNTTNKSGRILLTRYTTSEEPFQVIGGVSNVGNSIVQLGGGGGNGAPSTEIKFWTAALTGSAGTGTERGSIKSDGSFYMQGVYDDTTASAANVFVASDGQLMRSTSSADFKSEIEDMEIEVAKKLVRKFRAVFYRSKCRADKNDWSWYGAIAEEVAEIDPRFVHWGYLEADYEMADVVSGVEDVPVMEEKEVDVESIEIVDGVAVLTRTKGMRNEQVVDRFPVFEDGKPVMAQKKGKDGKKELVPVMYAKPRFERVEVTVKQKQLKKDATLRPIGLMYDRFTIPLMMVAQDFEKRLSALEK